MPELGRLRRHPIAFAGFGAAILIAGAALAARLRLPPVGNRHVPEPRKPVEVSRYLGRWFELARYPNGFERGCEDVTAEYSLLADGRIKVVNTCQMNGAVRRAIGAARVVPDAAATKLKVSFFGPLYLGNYWVLDRADDYSWAIVGEPSGRYLWLLGRKPSQATREHLVSLARELGYDTSMIHPTRQREMVAN